MAARVAGKPWMPLELFYRMGLHTPSLLVPRVSKSPRALLILLGHLPIFVCIDPSA